MSDELLTPAEVGLIFGKSARWVVESRLRYGWPHVGVGRTIRFTREHVDEIKRMQTVRPKESGDRAALDGQTLRSRRAS